MLKVCGKPVSNLGTRHGISAGKDSTEFSGFASRSIHERVKPLFTHSIIPYRPQDLSPVKDRLLSLIEHYFYPVSTAPTIIFTKEKLKKGI